MEHGELISNLGFVLRTSTLRAGSHFWIENKKYNSKMVLEFRIPISKIEVLQ